jgi:broad specificity phosphatase PhoE
MSDDDKSCHTIYLIRHGETVDNIAGVYAGITDSALTVHGALQGQKLGQYFSKQDVIFTHFFASDLSRAHKTAENIRRYQATEEAAPVVVLCPDLREQDFGFYEKKSFFARSPDSKKTGKDLHRDVHKDEEGFQDIETKEAMGKRADSFLDEHLMPLLNAAPAGYEYMIAIVSHGMLLSSLWKAILRRQKPNTVTLDQEAIIPGKPVALEHLGGWSNTGYLHLELVRKTSKTIPHDAESVTEALPLLTQLDAEQSDIEKIIQPPTSEPSTSEEPSGAKVSDVPSFHITIKVINGKAHLQGLKRTGGGVGSAKSDDSQKSLETFFKRRKLEK